jgi:hypothetical protein
MNHSKLTSGIEEQDRSLPLTCSNWVGVKRPTHNDVSLPLTIEDRSERASHIRIEAFH